jgi:hypothetical protein
MQMLTRFISWMALLSCLTLAACAGYSPPRTVVGMGKAELLAVMGSPEREGKSATGSRLEFPRGPYGQHTWFVYLDAAGTVTRTEQVLTKENFARISEGMTQDDVRQLLGRPSESFLLGRDRGIVWNYRYENNDCLWFQVEITQQQQVRSTGFGEPPECSKSDNRS